MKALNNFIIERLKLTNDTKAIQNFIYDLDGNEVYFDLDKRKGFKRMNDALNWVRKHCKIDSKNVSSSKLKEIFKKTNDYELNSICFILNPEDKNLIDAIKIKRNYEDVISNYSETMKDDEYIGEIIPYDNYNYKWYTLYTPIYLTEKGILSGYITNYPVYLSKENIFA